MNKDSLILVTGAAGFIGSYMTGYLNKMGYENLILVDEFDEEEKGLNLHSKRYQVRVERDNLFEWLELEKPAIDLVFHLGARTDTTEFDYSILQQLNVLYSERIWNYCKQNNISLIYASSAATYGAGEWGYKDDPGVMEKLKPLNPYGISKNEFDKWVIEQVSAKQGPDCWAGLKFFNVYGPNEYHKGRMASVMLHAFNQVRATGKVKLFKSHKPEFKDGEQLRDFVYVEDVAKVMYWIMDKMNGANWSNNTNGIYNLGTGKARTFKDLVTAIFTSLGLETRIEFIDTPEDIRDKYQYFTEADMTKLRLAGYTGDFYSLEEGINDYVRNFLATDSYY